MSSEKTRHALAQLGKRLCVVQNSVKLFSGFDDDNSVHELPSVGREPSLPVGVSASGFVNDGDQDDDEKSSVHELPSVVPYGPIILLYIGIRTTPSL